MPKYSLLWSTGIGVFGGGNGGVTGPRGITLGTESLSLNSYIELRSGTIALCAPSASVV